MSLHDFTVRLRAVTAALAPTVGQKCAEECARSIARILADDRLKVEHTVWAAILHRVLHSKTYGKRWAVDAKEMSRMYHAATDAWEAAPQELGEGSHGR